MGIIGFSLCTYVLLIADPLVQKNREAAIKYYYLSIFSSGLILFGIFLIYFTLQTTNFNQIQLKIYSLLSSYDLISPQFNLFVSLAFLFIGLSFKLSLFPGML